MKRLDVVRLKLNVSLSEDHNDLGEALLNYKDLQILNEKGLFIKKGLLKEIYFPVFIQLVDIELGHHGF